MKRLATAIIAAILTTAAFAYAAQSPTVAVYYVRGGLGYEDRALAIESELASSLKALGTLSVLSNARRDDLLSQPGSPERDCLSNECLSQGGRLLDVQWLITGDVGRVRGNVLVNLNIIEAQSGRALGIFSREVPAAALQKTLAEGVKSLAANIPKFSDSGDQTYRKTGPSGTLLIKTKPSGAVAYLDAYLVGRTPTVAYKVPVGEHSVTLVLEGHETMSVPVTVRVNDVSEIDEILLMRTGDLDIDTNPQGAKIYLDGKEAGPSPQKIEGVLVGNHKLRIEAEGFQPLETSVRIDENDKQKRSFVLKKQGVRTLVASQPDGATVYVDGQPVGATLFIGPIDPGKHSIVLRLAGYADQTRDVDLVSGQSYAFNFRMVRGSSPIPITSRPVSPLPVVSTPPPPSTSGKQSSNPEAQRLYDAASNSPDIQERIRLYRQSIALDPAYPLSHNDLGVDYAELERWDEAMSEYRAALALDPNYAFAHNNLGHAYLNTGKLDDAEGEFKTALKIDPNYATAHYNLGKVYFERERYPDAMTEFEATVRINPDHAGAYFNIGRVLKRLDKPEEAVKMYLKCLEADPDYIDAYFNLGDLYEIIGDRDAAVYYYRKYIFEETRPGEEQWIEKARERLKALGGAVE